ncbi:MAG: hypothetical protein ACK5B9_11490 [Flavobacteriia bacterium]|jgi:hypothetical protein
MEIKVEIENEKEEMDMTSEIGKIRDVDINKALNGWTLSYMLMEKAPGKSKMEHCEYMRKSEVFKTEESDAAFARFRSLKEKEESSYW